MQDTEVHVTQLGNGRSEPVRDPCGGNRIGVGCVSVIERDTVMLTDRAQGALSAPEAVELFVEYARIDDEHPIRSADPVEQRPKPVPMGLAIQDGQVEARIERDDRHTAPQLFGQRSRDLLDCLTRDAPLGLRPLGGDAMHRSRASGYLDAGIHQPRQMLRRLTAANEAHGCCNDAIGFRVDARRLDVERRKTFRVPAHTTTLSARPDEFRHAIARDAEEQKPHARQRVKES